MKLLMGSVPYEFGSAYFGIDEYVNLNGKTIGMREKINVLI
jgi:hypothetical protein